MNDVARSAGVSLKTVSRVVNGEPTVDPALVERVRAAVASLHYRPHLGASMLRRKDRRTGTIGLLLEDVGNPFSAAVHRAVEDEARARGVHVLTGSLDDDPERERDLARAFARRHADGLILAPVGPDQGYLALELPPGVPVVFVDRTATGFTGDSVLARNAAGASAAVRHLIAYGHRRIVFLGDLSRITTTRERRRGYLDSVGAAGLRAYTVEGLHDSVAAEAATRELFERARPPTALFTGQNLITIGAVRGLRALGRHHDVALVGFDDFPLADLLEPAVTVIAQDPAAMGRAAAQALFARIDGDTKEPREISVATTLIPRGSGEIPVRFTGSS
ncbi:LacI family DNA-binding transcriptional regulator [Actinoplanes friuliensis]|uniref:Putative LacI-family transcriptional regulator n=1 Tax=Actinoplanes friuliensis DSM 7358 TaxID=1246995 RepID=U5VTE1_9ACTN|nr:LacI family DNA-binding transcriptional regulator [Actinoplanes friuliensis]AGZ38931.1 putative LacI-family transcriptional regulator [Actinoplanes friuliensis DSM 7358]